MTSRSRDRSGPLSGVAALTLAALACRPCVALASEPMPARADRLPSPGRAVASEDGVEAVRVNPANLAFLPGAELRWTGVRCPDTKMVNCGHSLGIATPVAFDFTSGLRVDYVQPPSSADFPFAGSDYVWITWGLAYRLSESLSIGGSIQRSYSQNGYLDGLWGLSTAVSYRPTAHIAFSVLAHDWNNPSPQLLRPHNLPVLDRSYDFALAFRPTGRRAFEIGAELKYLSEADQVIPRATIAVDVPRLGRLRGDVEIAHLPNDQSRGVVASAGLEVYLSGLSVGGGALFGSGLGSTSSIGEYATASLAAYRSPGVQRAARGVTIRIEGTPGVRSHIHFLRRLWRLAEDKEIASVSLVLRAEPAASFAHAEELADAIRLLRAHGKKVLCSLEDNGARSLYVCANADRIVMNPAGSLRYSGLRTQYFYLAGLLEKIGVRAEFVRIGAHKSAPEQFTNDKASEVARADHEDYLHEVEAVFDSNLAVGRKLTSERIREATPKGPYTASEAKDAGFIDGFAFDDEVDRATKDMLGHEVSVEKLGAERNAPDTFGARGKVGVLYVEGDMVDGRSSRVPLLDMKLVGSYTMTDSIRALRDDASVRSVVLRIETPGGSSMAADVIWRELTLLAQKKPLIVSMGSTAASGGYYIAAAAPTIYALPLTLTGSIGIFYGKADVSGLLDKLGVTVETYKTTPRADAESFFRGFTDDERVELKRKVGQFYDVFLDRVARGRHMSKADVDAVGQGRVWTGQQALAHKLVDKMGGIRQALEEARALGNLPNDAPIVEYPEVKLSLLDQVLHLAGLESARAMMSVTSLPPQFRDVARSLAPMAVYSGDVPMARLEWAPAEADTIVETDLE